MIELIAVLTKDQPTPTELAKQMEEDGGFVRMGMDCALVRGKYIPAHLLIDGLLVQNNGMGEELIELKNTRAREAAVAEIKERNGDGMG